jgi:plasmid stabilization system protein ParE
MRIIWSDEAIKDFEQNLDYLFANWNERVANDFVIETEQTLKIILTMPNAFRKNVVENVHLATITKHITLIYQISNDSIELINFFNNFQKPKE